MCMFDPEIQQTINASGQQFFASIVEGIELFNVNLTVKRYHRRLSLKETILRGCLLLFLLAASG